MIEWCGKDFCLFFLKLLVCLINVERVIGVEVFRLFKEDGEENG